MRGEVASEELKTMQSLQGEYVCKLYGACEFTDEMHGEQLWLVMEYIEGGDLHNFLDKYGGPIPKELQLSFFIQATKALATLHNAPSPIMHRDIKSLNFLVQNNTKLLLTDFGISKAVVLTTLETDTIGTYRWVAPEIVTSNKRQWSEKADIYSLGMVFYEIVTGKFPYCEETNNYNILDKIKSGILPALSPDCPKVCA
jgi:serine/threonine protein kinase